MGTAIALPAFAMMMGSVALADSSKASPSSLHYQTTPNGNKMCGGCKFFIPGSDPSSTGSCQIVDGSVSPHGYCDAFNAK